MSRERFLRHHPRLSYHNGIFSGEDKIIAEVIRPTADDRAGVRDFHPDAFEAVSAPT